jgi:cytochrome d ubiquinol oxidase subunit II
VGGWFGWLTPFSLFTGLALLCGYALLGATWLVLKTEGELHRRANGLAQRFAVGMLFAIVAVSIWTLQINPAIAMRWFAWPNMAYLAPVPILVAVTAWALLRSLSLKREAQPFLLSLVLFVLSFAGLGISLYPYIVPPTIEIRDAAAPAESLSFLLAGAAVLLPIILGYTAHAYWVFRGKVHADDGYH